VQETVENSRITENIIPRDFNDILGMIATNPELRREMISWVQSEFGFNIESHLEKYFGELPDKTQKIEEVEVPVRELVEDIVGYIEEDGYSVGQTARMMKLKRPLVSKLYKDKDRYLKAKTEAAINSTTKKMPFLKRTALKIASRLGLI